MGNAFWSLAASGQRNRRRELGTGRFEPDRADARRGAIKRHVDRYRPVHGWEESHVWDIIQRWCVNVHPAYRLGWGRLSCLTCIVGSANQWASALTVAAEQVEAIVGYEKEFGKTIDRKVGVLDRAAQGKAYDGCQNAPLVAEAMNPNWIGPIFLDQGTWKLPAGALGESCGPT